MRRVPLASDARTKSYYRFIEVPLEPLSPDEITELTSRGDDADALEFCDRALSQQASHEPETSDVRHLASGGVLLTCVTDVPDITREMALWWFTWHQLDPLRYALWNPEDHFNVTIDGATRARLLDRSIPVEQRPWGTRCEVLESMNGEEPAHLTISFKDPAQMGYDRSLLGSDGCQVLVVSNDTQAVGPTTLPMFMAEGLRRGPDGRNQWVARWWVGCGVDESGHDVTQQLPQPLLSLVDDRTSILIGHSRKEMRHLNAVLPQLYAENHAEDSQAE